MADKTILEANNISIVFGGLKAVTDFNIKIKENKPLFIYKDKTVLIDGTNVDEKYNVPILINEINNAFTPKSGFNGFRSVFSILDKILCDINNACV